MAERRRTIYAAIAANLAIAVTKFIAAGIGGSTAMLAEALHSVVDTGDGLLLLLGLYLSRRPPSRHHPYGHGAEVYFWSLVVGSPSSRGDQLATEPPQQPPAARTG